MLQYTRPRNSHARSPGPVRRDLKTVARRALLSGENEEILPARRDLVYRVLQLTPLLAGTGRHLSRRKTHRDYMLRF